MIARQRSISLVPFALAVVVAAAVTPLSIYAAGALFATAAAALFLAMPQALVPAIFATSVLNRLGVDSGGTQVRLDLLMAILAFGVVLNRLAVRTLSPRTLASPIVAPLLAYAACNVLSTVLVATEKARGLKLDAQICAVIAVVLVLTALIRDRRDIERAVSMLWIVTVAEAAIGLLLTALYVTGASTAGVQAGDFGLPMAYGTTYEANIFGSLLLANFFLLLADYIANRRSTWHAAGLVLVLLGIAASETRTVWLGLLVGLAVFAALLLRSSTGGNRLLPVVTAVPILGLAAGVLGATTPLASRILGVADLHSSSASGRLVIFQAALSDWRAHPVLGLGTGSFNFGAGPGQLHPWLPNLFLLTLHDTGVVGSVALLWLIVRFYRATAKNLGDTAATAPPIAMGAIASFTALLIAFQTTSGFWFVYPWIVATLGVLAARRVAGAT